MKAASETNVELHQRALFMAALAHAFRSRLNAVLGSLELVRQTDLNREQSGFVATAVDEGRELLTLLNDALDVNRIEAGEVRLDDLPTDPVAIAEGALGAVAARLHERGVAAASVIDPQTPVTLRGDPARLRQVLTNLLANAANATDLGSIMLKLRPLASDVRGEHLQFEIIDTGRGVPEGLREGLFAPFVPQGGRADWRSTSLGLGLALCRHLVRMMGGDIEYEARRGGGSIFRFDVWLRRDAEFERLADVVGEAHDRRVLLVDSDQVRRVSFAEQVRRWGIRVKVVADGEAASVLIRSGQRFDLLLVHQDANGAADAVACSAPLRVSVLVPVGQSPAQALVPRDRSVSWLSAPMRRRAFVDALMGRPVPLIDSPDLPEATRSTRARILVVEDSDANRRVMSAQLERLSCDVDAVANGSDAIRQVSQRRYALVLTDLALPDMSGLDVAVGIRQLGGDAARVPIVAVTGGTHPRDRERCLAAGMNDYLAKPVARDDLRRVVERFVPRDGAVPVWSPAAVAEMASDFGAERTYDLVAAFARELAQRLDRLAIGTSAQQIGHEAHALKSAALVFGAESLGKAALALEQNCRNGLMADVQQETQDVVALGRQVYAAVQSWLVDRSEQNP